MSNGAGRVGVRDDRQTVSEWTVCLKSEVDRETYIASCYLTGTVSLANGNGEIQHDVRVGKLAMQVIDFPEKEGEFGSDVICVRSPYSGALSVVEVFYTNSQYQRQREGQYVFLKKAGAGLAALLIDGNGNITASVNGDKDNGVVTINITNENRAGKLNINVNGDFLVQNDGSTHLKSSRSIKAEFNSGTKSATVELNENGVKIEADKILLNESDEPVLLGNKTVQLISDVLTVLQTDSAGPWPLTGNAQYANLQNRLEELKSGKSFVK